MEQIRPLENGEEGKFIPVRELLEKQAKEARKLAGNYLIRQVESTGDLVLRPLVIELSDGTSVVQEFKVSPAYMMISTLDY